MSREKPRATGLVISLENFDSGEEFFRRFSVSFFHRSLGDGETSGCVVSNLTHQPGKQQRRQTIQILESCVQAKEAAYSLQDSGGARGCWRDQGPCSLQTLLC